jgi:hypothetical protein
MGKEIFLTGLLTSVLLVYFTINKDAKENPRVHIFYMCVAWMTGRILSQL